MIPHLKGWSKVWSGDALTIYPPASEGGADTGAIRYRERVRPLVRASLVVENLLARYPQFQVAEVSRPETLVTAEGEYAAHVVARGSLAGKPAQRDVGLVFGDDFYAMVSSLCLVPERFADFTRSVGLLVKMDTHALGTRRRRYLYTPPADWQGLPRGFTTEWSPADFPKNLSLIHVFPANPLTEDTASVLEQMLAEDVAAGFALEGQRGPEPIASLHGLTGSAWNLVGRHGQTRTFRDLVVFRDARYLYALRLETMQEERAAERAVFLDVVRSVQPIPLPTRADAEGGQQFGGPLGPLGDLVVTTLAPPVSASVPLDDTQRVGLDRLNDFLVSGGGVLRVARIGGVGVGHVPRHLRAPPAPGWWAARPTGSRSTSSTTRPTRAAPPTSCAPGAAPS